MMTVASNVNKSKKVFLSMLTLGLIGLLFLIVFGNLVGNLGFKSTSTSFINETATGSVSYAINGTTYTLAGQSTEGFQSLSVASIINATSNTTIASGNYTVDTTAGTIVGSSSRSANWTTIRVTYTVTHKDTAELNSDSTINNLTDGATVFFSFSNVWFTLLAVTLLIIIVIGVIGVVNKSRPNSRFTS